MLRRNTQSSLKLRQEAMSIQKPNKQVQQEKKLKQVNHQASFFRYHALLKQQLQGETPGVLFTCGVQRPAGTRLAHLVLKNTVYIISNWTSDKFPNVIYICLNGFTDGYKLSTVTVDNQGNKTYLETSTDRIAAMQLEDVNAIIDQSDVRTYELKYSIRDIVNWRIPDNMNRVYLSIKTDDSLLPQDLPLPNPMSLNLQIRVE